LKPFDPAARPVGVVALARVVLSVFFRRVEVEGTERVPRDAPLMVVANHVNGIIDPAVLLGFLPVRPRFLAKSTLWSNPVLRPFLGLAAAIPVYRRQDPGVDASKNVETFAACHEVLAAGGTIALFPEGRSHSEPALAELKTGVSRIVLEAEAKYGGIGSRILPVGLTYDDKGRFRSRVLMAIGEPLDPAAELALHAGDPQAAVYSLTERVRDALEAVTLNFPSWEEARLIERAAEIFARPSSELPSEPSLGERFDLRRAFIAGYAHLREAWPEEVEEVARTVRAYDERLAHYRLWDVQVAAGYPTGRVALFVLKSLALLLLRLPLAAAGIAVNYPPYWAVGRLARRLADSPDLPATYKVFGSLILYPLTWALWSVAVGLAWGLWPSLAVLGLGPLTGWFALRFYERRRYFQGQARAFLLLRSAHPGVEELRRLRGEVLRAVERLAEAYRTGATRASARSTAASSTSSTSS
jgi:1-acyl-sn-glycerol-3-phosphate acyltransferase